MAKIIDGKQVSKQIREKLRERAERMKAAGLRLGLAVILVGDDPASAIYVRNKIAACEEVGVQSHQYILPKDTQESQLLELIDTLNEDASVNGILVQLPLPKGLDEKKILDRIRAEKDVDGFHALNAGKLLLGYDCLTACTPTGVMELIKSTGTEIAGKTAVVVGRSNIVGKPQALLLLNENATVTVCHSKTKNLAEVCRTADILVVAVGRPEMITGDMVKEGAVVIDVGMNRTESGLKGDVNFAQASERAAFITPVPGGVGPMTITMLLSNTLKAAAQQNHYADCE